MIQRTAKRITEKTIHQYVKEGLENFFKAHFFRFEESRWARYRRYNGD